MASDTSEKVPQDRLLPIDKGALKHSIAMKATEQTKHKRPSAQAEINAISQNARVKGP
ncbi:hypothetical protein RGW39_18725 [Escherichia ruysiae]|nr:MULTISPECIES: hypothetical protein [Escherichia]EJH3422890.1 hypothetical protein [Escherichia coli]MDR4878858.1 hypothetical protein [Escherichia ruysiae]MDR4905769.1 hypothetical protein [Escherichia ruysiae]MDR4965411.1 hypothetical protein [Escherichia ruysiae]MDR4992959.1 hypothetical protein [Escherichia ruysiae]